jgi:hypothetical protein
MNRMRKLSAVLVALLFSAGAMAQTAGTAPTDSPTTNTTNATNAKMSKAHHKTAKKVKKTKKSKTVTPPDASSSADQTPAELQKSK